MAITSISGLVPLRRYTQEFNSSSTWACPFGTNEVEVFIVGGGGGGGSVNSQITSHMGAAGGGGGGDVQTTTVSVTPGTTYTVTVGAGGSGSTSATVSGGNGGDSSFGLTRTIANAHWYNHEYAQNLLAYSNNSTNTAAFVQPGGWFMKANTNGSNTYTLASPPAYTVANNVTPAFAIYATTISSNALVAANVPTGYNGYSYGVTMTSTTTQYCDLSNWVPVTASTQYTASGWFYSSTGIPSMAIRIEWYQAFQGTFISASNSTASTTSSAWTQITVTATAPAGATYALVRYQGLANGSSAGTALWANQQFEQGGTATSYKGPFTSKTWTQTGISNVTAGVIAAGGGGGASIDPNGTGTVPGIGGGGAASSQSGSNLMAFGGSGSGAGSPVVLSQPRQIQSTAGSSGAMYINSIAVPPVSPATGRGSAGTLWYQTSMGHIIDAGAASFGINNFGAGGSGGICSTASIAANEPVLTAGSAGQGGLATNGQASSGTHATANSGSGGGGGVASNIAINNPGKGGNGGSGKVIISYWGY